MTAANCMAAFAGSSAADGGSIFDDDWVPPKPAYAAPKGAAPASRPAAAEPPAIPPADVPKAVQPPVLPVEPEPARKPIPLPAEQARSRGLLRAAFAEQLKDRSPAARKGLARALLAEVPKSADSPSDQYVLLGGAVDASKDAGDLGLCFEAVDLMASRFAVDGLNVKVDAALRTKLGGAAPAQAADNVRSLLGLIEPLAGAEDYVTATRLLALARPAGAGDPELASVVQQQSKLVEARRTSRDRAAAATDKLKVSPEDPSANLALGTYLCFTKGEWVRGLPHLAKGSDVGLKQLAALDLAGAKSDEVARRLADGWWDVAAKLPEASRAEPESRAATLYKTLLDRSTGLQRTVAERRVAEAAALAGQRSGTAAAGRAVDVLRMVDPERDAVQGKFAIINGDLVDQSKGQQRIGIRYHPPKDYDLRIEFTRVRGSGCVVQILNREGTPFIWVLESSPKFLYLKGSGASNGAQAKGPDPIKNGTRYTSVLQVREGRVKAFLNGQLVTEWKTDFQNVNGDVPFWALKDKASVGLGISDSGIVFHSATVIEVSGPGTKVP